jgi:hypothetical protein
MANLGLMVKQEQKEIKDCQAIKESLVHQV